jgi:hypothetical protein
MSKVIDSGAISRFRRFAITPLFGVVTKGFNRGYEACPIPEMDGSDGPHVWRPLFSEPHTERCIFCCQDRAA